MRLSIEISPEQHQQIKMMAALQGKSIKELVLGRIFDVKEDPAWEELMSLLHDRIAEAKNGELSDKTPHQIAQKVLARKNAH